MFVVMERKMPFSTLSRRSILRVILPLLYGLIAFGLFFQMTNLHANRFTREDQRLSQTIIVASQLKDNTSWLDEHLSDWRITRYIVDDQAAMYTVPHNKGNEAMVYLTYIIDHFEMLPDLMLFIHGQRYQWHNDDPLYDGVEMLTNLQIEYLLTQGYANLRCVWTLGCPSDLNGLDEVVSNNSESPSNFLRQYVQAFQELFPGEPIPSAVSVACCAQFAVTRQAILERPLADYVRIRDWLFATPHANDVSGRIFEYIWHILFGKSAYHCPDVRSCYCKTFGLCNLECEENHCGERWPFPPSAAIPDGWPIIGWKGETRVPEDIAKQRDISKLDS